MLIGLDPLLTPDLLHALASMGHGDVIVLVDANYPATRGRRLVAVPGAGIVPLLRAILTLFPLDGFVPHPAQVMQVVDQPEQVPPVVAEMNEELRRNAAQPARGVERHAFYALAEQAYAIVRTGERRFYGNIALTKGVVPPEVQ